MAARMTVTPPSLSAQLRRAVYQENLENLREILDRRDEDGDFEANGYHIREALRNTACYGNVEACRILYNKLSSSGKRDYDPLHNAVGCAKLEVVRLFVEEFGFNVYTKNSDGATLLLVANQSLEITRYLLERGANPNQAGKVYEMFLREYINTRVENDYIVRPTDLAILNGNTEMLSLLLGHGALVAKRSVRFVPETWLSLMLLDATTEVFENITRETKLAICSILVEHAEGESSTDVFLLSSLENAVRYDSLTECCEILLESGVAPTTTTRNNRALYYAVQRENEAFCRLLVEYGADPFLNRTFEGHSSPFQASACKNDTTVLAFLLDKWDERFSSQGGKNDDGDYPIHVLCCDPKVSLEAIELVATRQPDTLATVDGDQGLFPFHFAAMWDAKLDLIFTLLKHCPDALSRLQRHAHSSNADDASSRSNDNRNTTTSAAAYHHQGNTGTESGPVDNNTGEGTRAVESEDGPVKKRAKTAL